MALITGAARASVEMAALLTGATPAAFPETAGMGTEAANLRTETLQNQPGAGGSPAKDLFSDKLEDLRLGTAMEHFKDKRYLDAVQEWEAFLEKHSSTSLPAVHRDCLIESYQKLGRYADAINRFEEPGAEVSSLNGLDAAILSYTELSKKHEGKERVDLEDKAVTATGQLSKLHGTEDREYIAMLLARSALILYKRTDPAAANPLSKPEREAALNKALQLMDDGLALEQPLEKKINSGSLLKIKARSLQTLERWNDALDVYKALEALQPLTAQDVLGRQRVGIGAARAAIGRALESEVAEEAAGSYRTALELAKRAQDMRLPEDSAKEYQKQHTHEVWAARVEAMKIYIGLGELDRAAAECGAIYASGEAPEYRRIVTRANARLTQDQDRPSNKQIVEELHKM